MRLSCFVREFQIAQNITAKRFSSPVSFALVLFLLSSRELVCYTRSVSIVPDQHECSSLFFELLVDTSFLKAILKDYEARRPGVFGPQGGLSRVFAINEVSFNAGLMIGPLLSGLLSESVGYSNMSLTLGKFSK